MSSVRAALAAVFFFVFRPRPNVTVWEWADDGNIILRQTTESQDYAGEFTSSLTPHTRFLMEFATDRFGSNIKFPEGSEGVSWKEFIFMKSSQSGVTLAVLIIITFLAANIPCNIIYTIDSTKEVTRINKTRLQPMLKDCKATKSRLSEDEDKLSNQTLYLNGLTIYLTGAYSAGTLANKSAGFVFADELDNHPPQPQGEANSIDLLRDRTKKVLNGKLVAFSKPKGEEDILNQEYLTGTRHKCFVPCPHCNQFQELVWKRVRFHHCRDKNGVWDQARVLKETFYECEHCSKPIYEHHKITMLDGLEWRPTNFGQDEHKPALGKISAHISDLYSLFPNMTWGHLAVLWINAQGNISKLKAFFTGNLALPWKEKKVEVKPEDIWRMCGAYEHGHCPRPPSVVLMASDVQQDVKKWVKIAFMADGEAFVVDYGSCLSYKELLVEADKPVIVDDWGDTPEEDRINPVVLIGLIDEGHDQKGVRDFCQETDERFYACKGRGGIQVKDIVEEKTNFTHNDEPIIVYFFSDDDFKAELYSTRIGKFREIEKSANAGERHPVPRLWFPKNPDPDFIKEHCQEKKEKVMKRGRWAWEWQEPKEANDWGDATKMCFVDWYLIKEFYQKKAA